jgi:hypothetical protein
LDAEGRIIAIFVGTPEDPDWLAVIAEMVKTFTQARQEVCDEVAVSPEASLHCRGDYFQFTEGASLGGGQRVGQDLSFKFWKIDLTHPTVPRHTSYTEASSTDRSLHQRKQKCMVRGWFSIKCVRFFFWSFLC